jgi:pimeloyl-ACP methyl ester carboxylesterase
VESRIDHACAVWRVIASPGYPPDPALLRERVARGIRRSYHPAGVVRQLVAVAASGDRTPILRNITQPTHVIHGRADPLVPFAHGVQLAERIPGATHDWIDGMGHDLPLALADRFADAALATAKRA